jgi:galactose mutarotase-like enzyme
VTTDTGELTLRDAQTGALAVVEPARGGIVTRFEVGGRPVLFMDPATLRDPTKNVRGGVPVLFPSPGKLVDDAWSRDGRRGAMKQHGFARNLAWQVTDVSASTATLQLAASAATRAQYPWEFVLEQTVAVRGSSLHLDHRVTNRGDAAMPFGLGFHPYFLVADAGKHDAVIATPATRAFDNVAKQVVALAGIELARPEVDLHLLDHGSTTCALRLPDRTIELRGSAAYTHWVVWTLAGRDFVCLEPWTCPGNALNTGDRLLVVAPGASHTLSLEIAVR